MATHTQSHRFVKRATQLFPGGVNSPVRAFGQVDLEPRIIAEGHGPHLIDVDGNEYTDFVGSFGPLILGHAEPSVVAAITETAKRGTSFGATTPGEVTLAERIRAAMPALERMRFVSSGTEATMSALRAARGYTGRNRIIKFAGCYHGHADAFLVKDSGSGLATLGLAGSGGVPPGAIADTISVPYNDLDAVARVFAQTDEEIAAIIVEPVACNMGLVLPLPGFLQGLRDLCDANGSVLIFDEVITGFRLALGGAQAVYDVRPDLTTLGKIVGGGLPVGVYGGKKAIMDCIAPLGPVYQAGTLSGNPLAMAAGGATLAKLSDPPFYQHLQEKAEAFYQELDAILRRHDRPAHLSRIGSVFHLWFYPTGVADKDIPPHNYDDIKNSNAKSYQKFFCHLLNNGVWLAPSPYEVGFIGASHTSAGLTESLQKMEEALAILATA